MKRNTIKWRIFKYNIIVIVLLIVLTTIVFNISVKSYIESDVKKQLDTIALRAEDTVLHRGPDFFPPQGRETPPPPPKAMPEEQKAENDMFRFYFTLDRSLREPLSVLNADYILLDNSKELINPPEGDYFKPTTDIQNKIISVSKKLNASQAQQYIHFTLSGTNYIAIVKPMSDKNTFGLGWLIVYSSLSKVNQLQIVINAILFAILVLSALVTAIFSSVSAKKISAPFSSLNQYIREISERKFGSKINMAVDDELQEFVNNINTMSEKLETFDKAQKSFFQNASHELRTPLTSIQSYAEGIKYDVVEHNAAADIIIDETKRMTSLVEDLLYLSRLDTIEENLDLEELDFSQWLCRNVDRMNGIAIKHSISIHLEGSCEEAKIFGDDEMLSRALTNIIGNCIRYARNAIYVSCSTFEAGWLEIAIADDGTGIDPTDLPNIFDRFYKGKKGNFGLGLAICKNIIDKHNGRISAENTEAGALFKIVLPLQREV